MVIGGNVDADPRIARELATGLGDRQAMDAIEKTIERLGLEPFQQALA